MARYALFLALVAPMLLVACGGGASEEDISAAALGVATPAPGVATPTPTPAPIPSPTPMPGLMLPAATPTPAAVPAPLPPPVPLAGRSEFVSTALETAQRQVISVASVSVEVEDVPGALAQARAVAESLGGFVEQLSSSGGPDRPQATVTIRVPQPQFFAALDLIRELGEVQSENIGSEDVTEQFIDLEARLKSSTREEQSLLSLLERTETVSEILALERELSRVRSEIERVQGQLNFLERRVDLATITITLFPPRPDIGEPPSASLTVAVPGVGESVEKIKSLVSSLDGVVDQVFLSGPAGNQRATVAVRVFAKDFAQALASVEAEGDVRGKELREGAPPTEGAAVAEEPDARMNMTLVVLEPSEPPSASLTVAVSDVVGSVNQVKQLVSTLGGVVDRSNLARREGKDSASLTLRVPRDDFLSALSSVEDQGKVRSKELREGAPPDKGEAAVPLEPDARIDLSLVEREKSSSTGLIVAIATPIGGTALVVLLGALYYMAYRAGRRRGSMA